MKFKFTKMHGCGNDYVYVNGFTETIEDPKKAAIFVSDRHKGIGSDGLIMISPSDPIPKCLSLTYLATAGGFSIFSSKQFT